MGRAPTDADPTTGARTIAIPVLLPLFTHIVVGVGVLARCRRIEPASPAQ
jgi:hypothetical protein